MHSGHTSAYPEFTYTRSTFCKFQSYKKKKNLYFLLNVMAQSNQAWGFCFIVCGKTLIGSYIILVFSKKHLVQY